MALRNIVTVGDPVLTKVCRPVTKFDDRLSQLIDDMIETLHDANGAGLAAPQIGVLRRVVIVNTEEQQTGIEGCLSLPGRWGIVTRPEYAKVRAQDRHGDWYEYEGEDLTARCFLHEIDHLDGHMYTEFAEKMLTPEELEELLKEQEDAAEDEDAEV